MYLERAKVTNFRGIRRLSVDFESDSTFLIGENQWGKTSLLKVLWMLLGRGEELCQFEEEKWQQGNRQFEEIEEI